MKVQVLRCKIHRAKVTAKNLDYEGSLTLGGALLRVSGIYPYEKIEVYNISNGERFTTYIIPGSPEGYEVELNGAAARKAEVGDPLIIASYTVLEHSELEGYAPKVTVLGEGNKPI